MQIITSPSPAPSSSTRPAPSASAALTITNSQQQLVLIGALAVHQRGTGHHQQQLLLRQVLALAGALG